MTDVPLWRRPDGSYDRAACMRFVGATSEARGLRWRGKLSIPRGIHPLVRLLFERMNAERITLRDVARRAGVQYDTVSMWRYRANPQLAGLEACLNVVGYELRAVRRLGEE